MTTHREGRKKALVVREVRPGYGGEIVLYQTPEGTVSLDVKMGQDTVWLSLNQMAGLFERDKSVISRHLRKIFAEKELDPKATVAFFATVQKEGGRKVTRQVEYYNLDAIISVGYRVNSKRGTQFRIWATQVLRDHILKGYSVNEKRLAELQQAIRLIARVADTHALDGDEATALLRVVRDYTFALDLLDDYDRGRLPPPSLKPAEVRPVTTAEVRRIVAKLRGSFGGSRLFGREKDESLPGALAAVFQSIGGRDAYPSLEEKAAHLLYFMTKNHPFVDGNKRIAAAAFLWFLEKNGVLYDTGGARRIAEDALVALTLLIAESPSRDKEAVARLVACLLQKAVTG